MLRRVDGLPMRRRARLVIWRTLTALRRSIAAMSALAYSKASRRMYTARSLGVSRSRTTSSADASSSARCTPASGSLPVSTGSGSQGPSGVWRRARADWATLRASRAVARDRKAAGLTTAERSVSCQRSQTSWTTSSASTALPRIRYAAPKRRGRSSSKAAAASSRVASPAGGRVSGRVPGRSVNTLITAPFRLRHPSMPAGNTLPPRPPP
ncbi:hypothetical protein VR45_27330 [Streptomyces sp. NRRL S-495]|nr:hypothetical protein VR45_27330 [Streptomyces sp. NRRL S-495]